MRKTQSIVLLAIMCVAACEIERAGVRASTLAAGAQMRECEATGKSELTINCHYSDGPMDATTDSAKIALVRAFVAFRPQHEGKLQVELSFKNVGNNSFREARTVYIEFDDEAGRNYIRRPLPHVDLRQVAPGQVKTFTDFFLAPALSPNRYLVRLWIPSSKAPDRFDEHRNLLLSGTGVAEPSTGLNRIATVTVER